MFEFSQALAETVKEARVQMHLTQNELASMIDIDSRTVLNIENCKGNPKMEVLYPLIRALKIDAREIFNPEMERQLPAIRRLRILVEDCSEQEAEAIISVVETVLSVLRNPDAQSV